MRRLPPFDAPQKAAAQLLYRIVGGVIPQSDKEQGMDVQNQHKQIALVSPRSPSNLYFTALLIEYHDYSLIYSGCIYFRATPAQ